MTKNELADALFDASESRDLDRIDAALATLRDHQAANGFDESLGEMGETVENLRFAMIDSGDPQVIAVMDDSPLLVIDVARRLDFSPGYDLAERIAFFLGSKCDEPSAVERECLRLSVKRRKA